MRHRTCYAVQAPSLLVVHAPSQTDILGVRHLSPGRRAHPLSFSHRQLTCTRRNGLPSRHPCVIDLSSMGVCPRRRPCHTQNPRHPQLAWRNCSRGTWTMASWCISCSAPPAELRQRPPMHVFSYNACACTNSIYMYEEIPCPPPAACTL